MRRADEAGFTLAELLVAMFMFSILSAGFYSVMFAGIRGSNTTESVVRVSEEARLGFNRMVRDVREAARIVDISVTPDVSFTVHIDFDADGSIEAPDEIEEFFYDPGTETIYLNGEVLMTGIRQVPGVPLFDYSSNRLEYDWSSPCAPGWPSVACPRDGVANWREIDRPPASISQGGNNNGTPDGPELPYLSSVSFAMTINNDDQTTQFVTEAQLRNARIPRT